MNVGVVGYSESVEALAQLGKHTECALKFWQPEDLPKVKLPRNVKKSSLEDIAQCSLIFFCAPAHQARQIARQLGEKVRANHVIVHTSRELEPESHRLLSDVLREETATHRIGFLTGPFRTADLKAKKSASGTLFSKFPEVHGIVQDALVSPVFRVYRSTDLVGGQIAASYSRVISFVYGVGLGMEQGPGVSATLFARGLAEIGRFVLAAHGQERTVFGMSGAGNLFVDVQEPFSTEVLLGQKSVEFGHYDLEKLNAEFGDEIPARFAMLVRAMMDTCSEQGLVSTIGEAALAIVEDRMSTKEAATYLMTLPVLDE